jgi:hypothetical protein
MKLILFLVVKFSVRVHSTYKASSRLLSARKKLQTLSELRVWLLSASGLQFKAQEINTYIKNKKHTSWKIKFPDTHKRNLMLIRNWMSSKKSTVLFPDGFNIHEYRTYCKVWGLIWVILLGISCLAIQPLTHDEWAIPGQTQILRTAGN